MVIRYLFWWLSYDYAPAVPRAQHPDDNNPQRNVLSYMLILPPRFVDVCYFSLDASRSVSFAPRLHSRNSTTTITIYYVFCVFLRAVTGVSFLAAPTPGSNTTTTGNRAALRWHILHNSFTIHLMELVAVRLCVRSNFGRIVLGVCLSVCLSLYRASLNSSQRNSNTSNKST